MNIWLASFGFIVLLVGCSQEPADQEKNAQNKTASVEQYEEDMGAGDELSETIPLTELCPGFEPLFEMVNS